MTAPSAHLARASALLDSFLPPAGRLSPLERLRLKRLVAGCFAIAGILLVTTPIRAAMVGGPPPGWRIALASAAGLLLLPWVLKWSGREHLVTVLALAVVHLMMAGLTLFDGATTAPAFVALPALPVASMLFAGARGGVLSIVKVLLLVAVTAALEARGVLASTPLSASMGIGARALGMAAATMALGAIGWLYEREKGGYAEALAESNERFELAAQSAQDTLFEWDGSTGTFFVAPTLGEILGIEAVDDPFERLHPEDRGRIEAAFLACRRGDRMDEECRLLDNEGNPVWFRITAMADPHHAVGSERICGWFRYIDFRKRMEAMKDEFLSTVSHELRTPLTSIRGGIGLVLGRAAAMDETTQQILEVAHRNTERLVRLVDDLLDVQRLNAGQMPYAMRPQQVASLLEEAAAEIAPVAARAEVTLAVEAHGAPLEIYGDGDRIVQVLVNLLSNAVKHAPAGGRIRLAARRGSGRRSTEGHASEWIRIWVEDSGPGVPRHLRETIFEPFTQAEDERGVRPPGTGLGLHISRRIVEDHGGRIWVEEGPEGGARFVFELPAAPVGDAPDPPP